MRLQASKRKNNKMMDLKTAKFNEVYLYLARVYFVFAASASKKNTYFDGPEISAQIPSQIYLIEGQ